MARLYLAALILIVFTVAPTTALGTCHSYKAVEIVLGPCSVTTAYTWMGTASHVMADFLKPQLMHWEPLHLIGTVGNWLARHCAACNLKPIIPPPRLA
ncbi:MAG: hypothetical protein H6658_08675 [Ardenticatenaceae bacterium]|nr:hypothetical protein [Ardenticatenaceae bacterium]